MRVALLACFTLSVSLAAAWQDTEKKFATVDGKVVDAITGQPVRKANLTLMQMPAGGAGMIGGGPPPSVSSATDQDGKFTFSNVEPGRYLLHAEKAGYLRQQYGQRADQPFTGGTNLTLEAGQRLGNLEFRLMPQGVISGRVLDEDGEPVSHAMISVQRRLPYGRNPVGMAGMSTNELGEFRIANLPPGQYFVRAEPRFSMMGFSAPAAPSPEAGKENLGHVPTYYGGTTDASSATPVQIAPGQQVVGIDVALRKARVYKISGKVVGAPSGGRTHVMLQPQRTGSGMGAMSFAMGQSFVRPDGSFIVPNVQPGSYDLVVATMDTGRPLTGGRTPVNVGNADVENVTVRVEPPIDVSGRVIVEGAPGGPVSGQVIVQPAIPGPSFTPPARIADDGTFRFAGVPRDKMLFHVVGLPAEMYVKSVRAGDQDIAQSGLTLSQLSSVPAIEIRLSPKGASVEGVIQDGDKPASGSMVMLVPQPFVADLPAFARKVSTTDQYGRFSLKGIAPGEYRLYAFETMIPMNELDPEQMKALDKFAVTLKLKEESREQIEAKIARLN